MRKYLLWWRNLTPETKKSLMQSKNIKAILYEQIVEIYKESVK